MNQSENALKLVLFILLSIVAACAPKPHVGEKITRIETEKGVQLTQADNRYIMPSGKLGGSESALVSARATVDAVDHRDRKIMVRTQDGQLLTITVGPEVVNFAQIKPGDSVALDYFTAVTFEAREPTEEEKMIADKTVDLAARAPAGEKPAAAAIEGKVRILTVEAINRSKELVVLKDSQGVLTTVKAKYPENLSYIKEGDSIVVELAEAVAASIRPVS